MSATAPVYRVAQGGIHLSVYIQPRAARNQIAGLHDGALKVRITAPPVEGRANREIIKFLSKTLKIAKTRITIRQGQTGRKKLIHIACSRQEQGAVTQSLDGLLKIS